MSCCIGIYQKSIHSSVVNADYAEIGEWTIQFLQEITGAIHLMVRSFSQVQKIVSVSGLLTDLAYILDYQKIRYINFKTYLNAMSFEARRLFLYLFTACKFLIFKNCFPLYRFDRYQGASTYT